MFLSWQIKSWWNGYSYFHYTIFHSQRRCIYWKYSRGITKSKTACAGGFLTTEEQQDSEVSCSTQSSERKWTLVDTTLLLIHHNSALPFLLLIYLNLPHRLPQQAVCTSSATCFPSQLSNSWSLTVVPASLSLALVPNCLLFANSSSLKQSSSLNHCL